MDIIFFMMCGNAWGVLARKVGQRRRFRVGFPNGIYRAGADAILTYFATEAAELLS